jgi:hypothetical protein
MGRTKDKVGLHLVTGKLGIGNWELVSYADAIFKCGVRNAECGLGILTTGHFF